MMDKKMLVLYGNALMYLYLFYVIGFVENERKKVVIQLKDQKALRMKHNVLVRTFEKAFNKLTAEEQEEIIEYANMEITFAELTSKID